MTKYIDFNHLELTSMFKRTKQVLRKIWAESTIYWDPAPSPFDKRKFTGWTDVAKALAKDIKEAVQKA